MGKGPQTRHARSGEVPAHDGDGGADAAGAVGGVNISETVDVGGVEEGEAWRRRLDALLNGLRVDRSHEQGEERERKTF